MDLTTIAQAAGLFTVTNIDDIVVLALFFAQGAGHRGSTARIVAGQYLGFTAILAAALAAAFGATFLPEQVRAYFGLLPLLLGLRAAWKLWRGDDDDDAPDSNGGPALLTVATVTFANGGDNIGVYVPVFVTERRTRNTAPSNKCTAPVGCARPHLRGSARPSPPSSSPRWPPTPAGNPGTRQAPSSSTGPAPPGSGLTVPRRCVTVALRPITDESAHSFPHVTAIGEKTGGMAAAMR
ncbi:hypothetical protein HDA32_004605 [Spinactinospora alkalitolerans]|uniref:Cadmium resistance transporter n=1 Tax=Spinactinospora alkalitolerans TaxID=687207 RepID=A0A852U1S9_9ACTN|nr:cadmium resistance transporter [Spinactinospora alkalitolerans]NYE49485.1 hypothetical protein [Spinactinospora alkalitolerans]